MRSFKFFIYSCHHVTLAIVSGVDGTSLCVACAGRTASIADLLADVRRVKMAGDGLRAACNRPGTASTQAKRHANSPGQALAKPIKGNQAHPPRGRTADGPKAGDQAGDESSPACTDTDSDGSPHGSCHTSFTSDSVDAALQAWALKR